MSSAPDEFMNGENLGLTAQDLQDPISVPVPGDLTAESQGATDLFDSSAANPSNAQSSNLSPNDQIDPTSGQANRNGNTALLFDENTGGGGGTDILIPSVPSQILEGVPQLIDTIGKWFNNPKKPDCKKNKYPVCCQKGAPQTRNGKVTVGRVPLVAPKVDVELLEYSQRRRLCRSWSADDPACQWPENIFCCYCKDTNRVGYFCYNQPYTDLPEFQNRPIPEPRDVSGPQQDPNPVEPGQKKRATVDSSVDDSQTASVPNTEDPLYAESIPFDIPENRGRKRKPETCTDKFLESVGVSTYRYKYPPRPKPIEDEDGEEWPGRPDEPIP